MTDEPFGRQPKPVTVRVDGIDERDIQYWSRLFEKGADRTGANVGTASGTTGKFRTFTIYPRAVND